MNVFHLLRIYLNSPNNNNNNNLNLNVDTHFLLFLVYHLHLIAHIYQLGSNNLPIFMFFPIEYSKRNV